MRLYAYDLLRAVGAPSARMLRYSNLYLTVSADERGSIGDPIGSTQYYVIFLALVTAWERDFMKTML